MSSIQRLLFIVVAIIGMNSASISYDDIQTNIFNGGPRDFEYLVSASTENIRVFFERNDISIGIVTGLITLRLMPYIGKFSRLVPMMLEMIVDESAWRAQFTTTIAEEITREVGESEVRWIEATLLTIQSKIKVLSDENSDDENRKTVTSIIHTELNRIVNLFELKSSLFRKYPLVGAPPLIHLASLVATFSPIAHELIPMEAMNPQISCKMYDLLLDYRTRTVMARLHKLHAKVAIFESLIKWTFRPSSLTAVMSLPYNRYGYSSTYPPTVSCNWGCDDDEMGIMEACTMDKFSGDIYSGRNMGSHSCFEEYACLLRHRVEELFPVEQLKNLCTEHNPKQPTGKFRKHFYFYKHFIK